MKKLLRIQKNRGMTYVELIVVLGIFAVMSSIVMFNYGEFQAKVDIKNWASDIALKIVEAQKSAMSGNLPPRTPSIINWKPSYGVYFFDPTVDNINFIYFTDLNNANGYEAGTEELDTIRITKGNYIDRIDRCADVTCTPPIPINLLSIAFKRPDSKAIFYLDNSESTLTGSEYIQITIKSPKLNIAKIKVYPSGRIQVN